MMNKTFQKAFIGIPKEYTKNNIDIYDTLDNIDLNGILGDVKNIPVIFYVSGSAGFTKGITYRKWIVENTDCVFFSPNTMEINNRPFYDDNSTVAQYEAVHKARQEEISFNIEKVLHFTWINKYRILLMGNSEGALAAGIYKGYDFHARLLLAWNCEPGYYISNVEIGAEKHTPMLTVIGTKDEYFSKDSPPNIGYEITGNCIEKLHNFDNVKNAILSNTGHNLLNNQYVKNEVIDFINSNL